MTHFIKKIQKDKDVKHIRIKFIHNNKNTIIADLCLKTPY